MLFLIVFSSTFALILGAGPADKNCTTTVGADTKYTDAAINCENTHADAACLVVYTPAVKAADVTERPVACFQAGGVANDDVKNLAIANCPKTCGYCCQTPAYSCSNVEFPRVRCETVTAAQCKDATWRTILAQDCPNVCGFCLEGGCVDAVVECANDPSICRNVGMQTFVRTNCQKTCGYCSSISSSTTIIPGTGGCADLSVRCSAWVRNGFCRNPSYTSAHKMQYCARSCNLC